MMRSAFITGASGFVGSALTRELLRRGVRCVCLVRSSSRAAALLCGGAEIVYGDIEDAAAYRDRLAECDAVFHAAGMLNVVDKASLYRVNAVACGILADACLSLQRPRRLVYISSLAASGPGADRMKVRTEDDLPQPVSLYGQSKLGGENELRRRASKLSIAIVRPGVVFGPRDPKVAEVVRVIRKLGLHPVVGFRTPRLSLIYVDDLAKLVFAVASDGKKISPCRMSSEGCYFACDDRFFPTYWEFGKLIARSMGQSVFVWPLWGWVAFSIALVAQVSSSKSGKSVLTVDKVREACVASWASSSRRVRNELGITFEHSLEERIAETTRWYRDNGWV